MPAHQQSPGVSNCTEKRLKYCRAWLSRLVRIQDVVLEIKNALISSQKPPNLATYTFQIQQESIMPKQGSILTQLHVRNPPVSNLA